MSSDNDQRTLAKNVQLFKEVSALKTSLQEQIRIEVRQLGVPRRFRMPSGTPKVISASSLRTDDK